MSLTAEEQKIPTEMYSVMTANRLLNIQVPLHSLELALDVECYFICSLKDFLQAHDVVGVGVAEEDVVWKAADFYGLWTASD